LASHSGPARSDVKNPVFKNGCWCKAKLNSTLIKGDDHSPIARSEWHAVSGDTCNTATGVLTKATTVNTDTKQDNATTVDNNNNINGTNTPAEGKVTLKVAFDIKFGGTAAELETTLEATIKTSTAGGLNVKEENVAVDAKAEALPARARRLSTDYGVVVEVTITGLTAQGVTNANAITAEAFTGSAFIEAFNAQLKAAGLANFTIAAGDISGVEVEFGDPDTVTETTASGAAAVSAFVAVAALLLA